MSIKIKRVKYQNILTVGDDPIDIELDKYTKTLINGTNGTGKSTIIEAIYFALYGAPFRDIKRDQLINGFNKAKLLTEVWIQKGEDEIYIQRGIKPNVFEFAVNGELIDKASTVREHQNKLENILELPNIVFKQLVVLGTAGYKPFMRLTPAERRNLIELILGLNVIADMDKLNKEAIKEINNQIKVLEMQTNNLEDQITKYHSFEDRLKTNNDDLILENEEKYKKIASDAKKLKTLKEETEAEIAANEEEVVKLNADITNLKNSIRSVQDSKLITKNKIDTATKLIELFAKGGTCPTCLQELDKSKQKEIEEEIKKLKSEFSEIDEEEVSARELLNNISSKMQVYQAVESKLNKIEVSFDKYIDEAKRIKQMINSLKVKDESKSYASEIAELEKQLKKIVKESDELVNDKFSHGIVGDLLKEDGIKKVILANYIPYFNDRIQHYLDQSEADYGIYLNETFVETVRSRGREEYSYNSFSEGEKSRIDLALLFSWRDVAAKATGIKVDTLIMDEVFDSSLDSSGIQAIHRILDGMGENVNSVIISHREDNEATMYSRVLKTIKNGLYSSIEEENFEEKQMEKFNNEIQ